jgi:S1-C subfamily serine protease
MQEIQLDNCGIVSNARAHHARRAGGACGVLPGVYLCAIDVAVHSDTFLHLILVLPAGVLLSMSRSKCSVVVSGLVGLLLAGCSSTGDEKSISGNDVIDVETAVGTELVRLAPIVVDVVRGGDVGSVEGGSHCLPDEDLFYGDDQSIIDEDELTEIFRNRIIAANIEVVGDPVATPEQPSQWIAERVIAGTVYRMKASICYSDSGIGNSGSKGIAVVNVDWKIHGRTGGEAIFRLKTEGYGEVDGDRSGAEKEVFRQAFSQAIGNLLADPDFQRVMSGTFETVPNVNSNRFFSIKGSRPWQDPLETRREEIVTNVVTIFVEDRRGFGFFVDDQGHVLTNARLVGAADLVAVKFANGDRLMGDVIATNAKLDVALIKTEPVQAAGLPLQTQPPALGSPVFASASSENVHTDEGLARGTVNAHRVDEGVRLFQSEIVAAPHSSGGPVLDANGNVIGITANPLGPVGDSNSISLDVGFFVPIADALDALGVQIIHASPPRPKTLEADTRPPSGNDLTISVASGPESADPKRTVGATVRDNGSKVEPLPAELPLPGIWSSKRNDVWGYQGFGGAGDAVTILTTIPLQMIDRKGGWGLFSYQTPRGTGQKWLQLTDVHRNGLSAADFSAMYGL